MARAATPGPSRRSSGRDPRERARTDRNRERSGQAPGRGATRTRASARPTASPPPETVATVETRRFEVAPPVRRTLALSWRAVALLVVITLLAISYGTTLPTYLRQQREAADFRAEIAAREANISSIEDQIRRWQDPDYVRAQARDRLGWAIPGETSYVVVGSDGKPIKGSSTITRQRGLEKEPPRTWWQKGWESVRTADSPGKK